MSDLSPLPNILSIGGSDPSGGAGIQADIKTIQACGGYGMAVVTALTAQNSQGIGNISVVSADCVKQQISCLIDDLTIDAVKIGMVYDNTILRAIKRGMETLPIDPIVVIDPILNSGTHQQLIHDYSLQQLVSELAPFTTLLTPNISEAEEISGMRIQTAKDLEPAGIKMLEKGLNAILITGGHLSGNEVISCLCYTDENNQNYSRWYRQPRVHGEFHGTGCTLSTAIATYLAKGSIIEEAVEKGLEFVQDAINGSSLIKGGSGQELLNHQFIHLQEEVLS